MDLTKDVYDRRLNQFFYSAAGGKYRLQFRFDGEPSCTEPSPDILVIYSCSNLNVTQSLAIEYTG